MKFLRELLFPLIAVLSAFAVGALVVLFIGDSPAETYRLLLGSAFSWPDGIGYTLFFATPLIFTGLAVAFALAVQHLWWIRTREREACFRAFLDNHWLGFAVFSGVALDFAVRLHRWPHVF